MKRISLNARQMSRGAMDDVGLIGKGASSKYPRLPIFHEPSHLSHLVHCDAEVRCDCQTDESIVLANCRSLS